MNAEELRKKIGNRTYNINMKKNEPEHYAFLNWHEKLTGGVSRDNTYQWKLLQALDDEELMARYARFVFEQGE